MDLNDEDTKAASGTGARQEKKPAARANRDVGQALRSVYTDTVAEEIPADLLALLGKLD